MGKKRDNREKLRKHDRNPNPVGGIFIALITFLIIMAIYTGILVMPKSQLAVGEIAETTIKATRDVEDTYTTNANRQEAGLQVGAIYRKDAAITSSTVTALNDALDAIDLVMELGAEEYERMRDSGEDIKYTVSFYEECLKELPDGFIIGDVVSIIQISEEEEYVLMKESVLELIETEMENGVIESALDDRKTDLKNQLILSGLSNDVRKLGSTIIDLYLVHNMTYDVDATEAAKEAAEEEVEPTMYKEGEIIVYEGTAVTEAQLNVLISLGMVEDTKAGWVDYVSVGSLLLIIYLAAVIYLMILHKEIVKSNKMIAVICIVSILTIILTWAGSFLSQYFIPIAYTPLMLVMVMMNKRAVIVINVFLSILVGIMATRLSESMILPIITASIISGTVSVYISTKAGQRSNVILSGFISGFFMGLVFVCFDMINHVDGLVSLLHFGYGVASGLVVAIITIGLLPIFESTLKLVTPMRLMELINPNQPLLKQLLVEAPGTYHHSIMVGNMAERAASAIGANELIVRAGAYYHDIGKTKRPYFFIENHADSRNPHDNIDSAMSVNVITAHVSDGLEMAKKANIPQVILDVIGQHHGDTAVMYFYLKDKEESNYPENIKLDDYRYPGIRPRSREAAIVMLADSCEAAVKSLDNATKENVEEMISKVIKGKLDDGQLDYCELTLKDITIIKEQFLVALNGVFHERIEYPD